MSRQVKSSFRKSYPFVMRALTIALATAGYGASATAGPNGGNVVQGTASISTSTSNGTVQTLITQATPKAVINWSDFSIPAAELVKFMQQAGATSVTLNRVTGGQASNIQGALQANGNIFLINPNGIVFGAGARVDVAGLLASTLDVDDQSFMQGGRLQFSSVQGVGPGKISNQGEIKVGDGGFVYLVAPSVDNSGHVIANVGRVTMAAGNRFEVDLQGSNLINFNVSADALTDVADDVTKIGVSNSGEIRAQNVLLSSSQARNLMSSVVNNSGLIEATALDISSAEIIQSGAINASGVVTLKATSAISAPSGTLRAGTLNLSVTADGASIGEEGNALRFDAEVLNAHALNGHIVVTDTAGGVALGEISTGNKDAGEQRRALITAEGGSITSAAPSATNVRAWAANLVSGGAIGTASTTITTAVDVISASTQNGGIYLHNVEGQLLVGDIVARESVMLNGQSQSAGAMSDANGQIRLSTGAIGTKDVSVRAVGDIFLSGSISAGNTLGLSSDTGNIYNTNDAAALTGRVINLTAGKDIGIDGSSLRLNAETLNASTTDGNIYVNENRGLTVGSVRAGGIGHDVSISLNQGDLKLGSVVADGGIVALATPYGAISDNNGTSSNVRAKRLTISSDGAVGSNSNALETSVETADVELSAALAGAYFDNDRALSALDLATRNGDARVSFVGGQFSFTRTDSKLTASSAASLDLRFSNQAGGIVVSGVQLGDASQLALTSSGSITQGGTTSASAKAITLDASTGIGNASAALITDTQKLNATARQGSIRVSNAAQFAGPTLSAIASATGTAGAVNIAQQGDLIVDSISATGQVTLSASGKVLAGPQADTLNVNSGGLQVSGMSIGTETESLKTNVAGAIKFTSSGDVHHTNVGAVTLLDVTAGAKIVLRNTGDVVVGKLQAGQTIDFDVRGSATDGNGTDLNFVASGLEARTRGFGTASDALELRVARLVIDTTNGGIYATNTSGDVLQLVRAKSTGVGSDIRIAAAGDIALGVVDAGGNAATLKSSGAIEDARVPGTTSANVTAQRLDIDAAGGVGLQGDLALDVSRLSAAGGNGGVKATNAGAIAVDSQSLVGKGLSEISIIATDITVLDNNGGTITMDGGKLVLTATTGNIVFLNQSDTIYLPGGGSITLTALGKSDLDGYSGAIVAGNLKTDGGAIRLQAQSNITIGMLDAGNSGDVTVISKNGMILDGNGSRENIVGNHVVLQAHTPSLRDAELTRDTAVAEYAAKVAEANAKLFDLQLLIQQLASYENQVQSAAVQKQLADTTARLTQLMVDAQAEKVDDAEAVLNRLNSALKVATLVRNAVAFAAGAAQAVPFSGDGGADAIFAGIDVAMSIADLALDSYDRYTFSPLAAKLDDLNNQLDLAKALLGDAATNLNMATVIRDTVQTSKQMADVASFKANTARDASAQIRKQAVAAYDSRKDIDSSAEKPLGISANQLDVNAGGVLNTSLYLETQGKLGLGSISVATGEQISVKAAQDISVLGTVASDKSIRLDAGGAIVGAGGTLVTPSLAANAANGIGVGQALNTRVSQVAASGGQGGVALVNRTGALLSVDALGSIDGVSGRGAISIDTDGALAINRLVHDTSDTHTVTLRTGGGILDGNASQPNVKAGQLVIDARGSVSLDTEVQELNARIAGAGDLSIRDGSDLVARRVSVENGRLAIDAGGHMTLGSLTADGSDGVISLSAGGRIEDDNDSSTVVTGRQLQMTAVESIGSANNVIATHLGSVSARTTGPGSIWVHNAGLLVLSEAVSAGGDVHVTAGGDIVAGDVQALAGAVSLDATSGGVSSAEGGSIRTRDLQIQATNGVRVHTQADAATVSVSGRGDVEVRQQGSIFLNSIATTDGNVTVTTDGTIGVGQVSAAAGNGDASLTAGETIVMARGDDAPAVVARELTLRAARGIGESAPLRIEAARLKASTDAGNVWIAQTKSLAVDQLVAGGDVMLTVQQGDATLGTIRAGGKATLSAQGALVDDGDMATRVGAKDLALSAGSGVRVQTQATSIAVNAGGEVDIDEIDGLTGVRIASSNGDVSLRSASGDISFDSIEASGHQVTLQTASGMLADRSQGRASVIAQRLKLDAARGIGTQDNPMDVAVEALSAQAGTGGLYINNLLASPLSLGEPGMQSLASTGGDIVLTTVGALNISGAVVAAGGGNVALQAGGDIAQGADISTTGRGDITLTANGNIDMANGTSTVSETGNIRYQAGGRVTVSSVRTDAGTNGGSVTFSGNAIGVNESGRGSVRGLVVTVDAPGADEALVRSLVGEQDDNGLIRVDGRVVGGTLTQSRRLIGDLVQPIINPADPRSVSAKIGRDMLTLPQQGSLVEDQRPEEHPLAN